MTRNAGTGHVRETPHKPCVSQVRISALSLLYPSFGHTTLSPSCVDAAAQHPSMRLSIHSPGLHRSERMYKGVRELLRTINR